MTFSGIFFVMSMVFFMYFNMVNNVAGAIICAALSVICLAFATDKWDKLEEKVEKLSKKENEDVTDINE